MRTGVRNYRLMNTTTFVIDNQDGNVENVPVTEATAAPSALGQTPDIEPRLGAVVQTDGTTFTLWAPAA